MSRKNSPIIVTSLLAMMFLILMGCSSSSQIKVSKPLASPIPKGKSVVLSITAGSLVREKVDKVTIKRYIGSIRRGLFGLLPSEGLFARIVNDGGPSDYTLEITLTGMRKISGITRALVGVMAGPNYLRGDVVLKENKSGNVLTQFEVTSNSASVPFSGESTPEDASREFVKEIINTFQSRN